MLKEKSARSKKKRREEIRRKFLIDINFLDRRKTERRKCWRRAVKVSTVIDKDVETVYDFVKHVENFPQFIENIKSIKIIKEKNNRKVADWKIDVQGVPVQWREEIIFDDTNKTMKFKMLEGDYEVYEGEWKFLSLPRGTQIFISVNLGWGFPSFETFIGDVLRRKVKLNFRGMLRAIRQKIEKGLAEKWEKFALIVHPHDVESLGDWIFSEPNLKRKRRHLVERMLRWIPPFKRSSITGIQSLTGRKAEGEMIILPLIPEQILKMDSTFVLQRIKEAGELAQNLGVKIVGLGAYAAWAGKRGVLLAKELNIPVTTGTSYTIEIVVQSVLKLANDVGIKIDKARISIIGATGLIGSICSAILAEKVPELTLMARNKIKMRKLADSILEQNKKKTIIKITDNLKQALAQADIVVVVTSAPFALIKVEDLNPGTIVCDVSLPHNVSPEKAVLRKDVLVIDGGIVQPPGKVDLHFNAGLPMGLVYACMAETMILALEEKYEYASVGGNVSLAKVRAISKFAIKHGFKLAQFRSFGKEVSKEQIEAVKKARKGKK